MSAALLCEVLQEVNLPKGVVNMVFGEGVQVGEALVRHPDVPLISFTGGSATGRKIMQASAENFKKLSLELGGKNPNIIFADCDFKQALETTLRSSFLNQGEICLCGSRIYVEEQIYAQFISEFVQATQKIKVGDPQDPLNFMGAIVHRQHYEKIKSFIEMARAEGGKILTGGKAPVLGEKFKHGYFLEPTVITELSENSACVQEEIFGPVVTIAKFQSFSEVMEKANAVKYGLSASVWSNDLKKAHLAAEQLQVGTVWINTWLQRDLRMPFGGMKASGLGREGGDYSLDFFTELTTVNVRF